MNTQTNKFTSLLKNIINGTNQVNNIIENNHITAGVLVQTPIEESTPIIALSTDIQNESQFTINFADTLNMMNNYPSIDLQSPIHIIWEDIISELDESIYILIEQFDQAPIDIQHIIIEKMKLVVEESDTKILFGTLGNESAELINKEFDDVNNIDLSQFIY